MKINVNLDKGEWIVWEDGVEFLLRPYPMSQIDPDISETDLGVELFKYCVVDWKGLMNEETSKPVRVSNTMKKYLYDHFPGMSTFVINTITKKMREDGVEIKN